MAHYIADFTKLKAIAIIDIRKALLGVLTFLATTPLAQAERLTLPLALPQGAQECELQG